jgi:FdhE protein
VGPETARPGAVGSHLPGEIVQVRVPDAARVFARRAARFRALGPGHVVGEFLEFLGQLAGAQANAVGQAAATLGRDGPSSGTTPLSPARWRREPGWRLALDAIVSEMRQRPLRPESVAAFDRLAAAPPAQVERWADAVLAHDASQLDTAAAPIVAAALQVRWTCRASILAADALAPAGGACPLCGSAPVAGVVLGDRKLRYVVCPLCATEWHLTRLTCASCGETSALSYLTIDGATAGVKAEACGACRTYLKLFYLEQLPSAEAVADDVATLALDLLMAEEGYTRAGSNPLLVM